MRWKGQGALGVWHGIAAGEERAVDDWYNREHHRERVAIPGFLRARRYVNLGPGRRYFSRYDVSSVGVLASAPYLAALNSPSPWSQRVFPAYRDTLRGCFEIVARHGAADGGFIASLRFAEIDRNREAEIAATVAALSALEGVLAVEAWRIDAAVTTHRTREKDLRASRDAYPAAALLIDAASAEAARAAIAAAPLHGLAGAAESDIMQLVYQALAEPG